MKRLLCALACAAALVACGQGPISQSPIDTVPAWGASAWDGATWR